MGRSRLMQELGGELRVTGVPSHIRKVMRLSGLDKLAVMEPEGKRTPSVKSKTTMKAEKPPLPDEPVKTLTVTVPVAPEVLELPPLEKDEAAGKIE